MGWARGNRLSGPGVRAAAVMEVERGRRYRATVVCSYVCSRGMAADGALLVAGVASYLSTNA